MVRFFGAALISLAVWANHAGAADIAVDVSSGTILTSTDADALRLPASLAKLMTAFVAFEAMEAGEITDGSRVTVSKFAAARPPVKLRLRAGTEIKFADVLGAAVVGSKNDAAVVVAEAVAGSQRAFVERMNDAASRLGMTNSRFANATGLPEAGQRTTARDIALLSRALLMRFPQRARLLSKRSVSALGRRVSTTNPLFGRVRGAGGLKTGFTCAAGYSVAALVERDGRKVIAVTLGHASKNARLSSARGLIEAAFKLPVTGETLDSGKVRAGSPPDIGACSGAGASLVATDISPEEKALYAAELAKARARADRQAVWRPSVSNPPPLPAKPPSPPPLSGWAVFMGAFPTRDASNAELRVFHRRIGGRGTIRVEGRPRDGKFLAVIYGLEQRTASALCKSVSRYCVTLTPARLLNTKAQWRR